MIERLVQLEAAVGDIKATVARMEDRITRLERDTPIRSDGKIESSATSPDLNLASDIQDPLKALLGTSTLVGRSLLVLAGAFLLRAMTENGTFAPAIGVAAGLSYASVWIVASAVAASKASRASAGFYAACSAVIACPLLLEASTSFDVMSPTASLVALAVITSLGLAIAAWWGFQSTAWVFSIGAVVTGAAIATMRPPGEAATAFLIMLGLVVFQLSERHSWDVLKWVTAFAADLAVVRLTTIATATGVGPEILGPIHPSMVAILQAVLVIGFVGMVVVRALREQRPLTVFDFVQTAVVGIVGWGGALQLARTQEWDIGLLSAAAVGAGLAAYYAAFGVVDRRQGRNRAFYYLSSLALCLLLIGVPGIFSSASSVVLAFIALTVAAVGSRWDRVTLRVHALVLLISAWVLSGLGAEVASCLTGSNEVGWSRSFVTGLIAVVTVGTTAVAFFGRRLRSPGWAQRLPLTGLLAMSAVAISFGISSFLNAILPGNIVTATETVALSLVTVSLALLASRWKVAEAGWLVYPYLVLTGLRMIAVDLSSGQTVVLVIALTAYGAALILSTRLVRTMRIEPEVG